MSLERGKPVLKAFQKGSPHGKFNSLYGTGDHPSEGGKIVDGVDGKIHIMGDNIEDAIMKIHPEEGEYILMQRNGYNSFAEVPVSEDGNRKYSNRFSRWLRKKQKKHLSNISDRFYRGGAPESMWDRVQLQMGWGEYSEEELTEADVEKRLGSFMETGFENLQAGTDKMVGEGGFIQKQLSEQLEQFGIKKDMLTTAGQRLDTQTTGVQTSMGQYAGARDQQKKTGLITDTSPSLEAMETQGKMQMANIGASRKDISSQRQLIGSQERGAETQAEIDIAQGKQRTQQALASMLSDYMTATGETIDQSFLDMFTDYQEGTFESVEDYT